MSNADSSASPIKTSYMDGSLKITTNHYGLTKREHACISLLIPETGDAELDALITKARREKHAAMALQGMLANLDGLYKEHLGNGVHVRNMDSLADASIKQGDSLIKGLDASEEAKS